MFPHIVVLRTNKRILESDRPMLKAIKADIESNQMTVEAIVKKYFANRIIDSLDDLKPNKIFRGVSFFDSSSRSINRTIHEYFPHNQKMVKKVKTLENEITHYFHSHLICKRSMRLVGAKASKTTKGTKATKGIPIKGKLCPNYVYKVLKMTNKKFTIMDVLDKTQYEINIPQILKNFSLPYVNTVHAAQGDKIAENFVIADWKCEFVDLKWLYTALTRCTRLDQVFFLKQNLYDVNINTMIAGYKMQDKAKDKAKDKAGKIVFHGNDDYVDHTCIRSKYKGSRGQCRKCNCHMTFEKHCENKVTVNRINNDIGHYKHNCELLCLVCNKTLRNLPQICP